MDATRKAIYQQWDKQEQKRIVKLQGNKVANIQFVMMNNMLLQMERGDRPVNRDNGNKLLVLLDKVYPLNNLDYRSFEFQMQKNIRASWERAFENLPGWNQW